MPTKNAESSQGDGGTPSPPPPPPSSPHFLHTQCGNTGNTIFKSGPLSISSKGIGWTSWKKRWFILTRTSLVFFRSDPSAVPQKGSEVNLTLGGIDLNNSGSVEVKADKKLLTVLFPDGREGRTFTLKAETSEDLYEWKAALENALAKAPNAAHVMGQNGIFRNDQTDIVDGSLDQLKDRQPVKSTVVGRPVLLALEDVDGAPSFLEKSLRFIEEYGVKVEGILRQAAAVDDVELRIREYEQGKIEFTPEEDAHVICDCFKYVLRELPSSPVPASCCKALLEACRTDRGIRVDAMRTAICETFPEPNRRLLQRVLVMMRNVVSHKAENRMSSSAVAACMAPLLLRPLLAGDCEIENDFDVGGDGSAQLLQAAAAANHAQAIVITLLEQYDDIFGEGSMSPEIYTESEESGSESAEATDDDGSYEDDEHDDASNADVDDDLEDASIGTWSESGDSRDNDLCDDKDSDDSHLSFKSPEEGDAFKAGPKLLSNSFDTALPQHDDVQSSGNLLNQSDNSSAIQANQSAELLVDVSKESSLVPMSNFPASSSCIDKSTTIFSGPLHSTRRRTILGRNSARKNLSMESVDFVIEDEFEIQRLEAMKTGLENRIAEEAKGNAYMQTNLERQKKALYERRLALEQDVARLQEQLLKERDLRTALETGLQNPQCSLPVLSTIDEKTKAELEELAQAEAGVICLKQKMDDLGVQINQQREQNKKISWKDKHKDTEDTATSLLERSSSKDSNLDGAESKSERKLSAAEPVTTKSMAPTTNRKAGTRGEGTNSTSFALSKLTTRLNFLKEKRSQIANDVQNMDRGREPGQHNQNLDKGQGSEVQSVQEPEADYCMLVRNSGKGVGSEV